MADIPKVGSERLFRKQLDGTLDDITDELAALAASIASANFLAGTSTTSVTVGTGTKVFTTQTGKAFFVGAFLTIVSVGQPLMFMFGQVVSYVGTTLTVNVLGVGFPGTRTDWNILVSGVPGTTGADGADGATGADGLARPCGRLTPTSGSPVVTGDATVGTIYYTPYIGDQIPLYDGSSAFVPTTFTELSNALNQSSSGKAGPAAVTTNSNYDLFVWDDSGTLRLTRGPLWSSGTSRGSGAGTTQLTMFKGFWFNAAAISNGPAQFRGTYVGTIRTNGSSQAAWVHGGAASGGTAAILGFWNAYNRVRVTGRVSDSTSSWSYATASFRSANNSTGMRVSWVNGFDYDSIRVAYMTLAVVAAGKANAAIGLDSTSSASSNCLIATGGTSNSFALTSELHDTSLGFHFAQALERAQDGVSVDFYSGGNVGLIYDGWF